MTSVTADDLDALRHMLGCEPERRRTSWGFRNHFVADKPEPSMERLVAAGFVVERGARAVHGGMTTWTATREGCRAAGMTDREIARMEPQP